jgi:hypothetical protein
MKRTVIVEDDSNENGMKGDRLDLKNWMQHK